MNTNPVKILSVDDELDLEDLFTQYFRRKIRKGEYEFTFVHDGLEALQTLLAHPDIDIILSDINMPEMDGLTLLAKINEMRNPALKCIMVSAYGDMENIRTAMNEGAFDFTTKPINLTDLERTIEKAVAQIQFIKKAQLEHSQLESIRSDLHVAQEIQQTILPKNFHPFPKLDTLEIYAHMNAAQYVGGDFYDFFPIDDCRLGFVIADVSGKGVPAAIFMAISRTVIRAIALTEKSAAECMARANTILCGESVNDMFVTAFYGILNVRNGLMLYCNAGHNLPLLLRGSGEISWVPKTGDLVLGAYPNMPYHEQTLQFELGDSLLLYTDGVTEAQNKAREFYGNDRLIKACRHLPGSKPEAIIQAVSENLQAFTKGAEQSDDITMLAIKVRNEE